MSLLFTLRNGADQWQELVSCARRCHADVVDVSHYLEVDEAVIDLKPSGGRNAWTAETGSTVRFGAKSRRLDPADAMWFLGPPALHHLAGQSDEDREFARTEWLAFVVSLLAVVPNRVLWLPEQRVEHRGLSDPSCAGEELRRIGWTVDDVVYGGGGSPRSLAATSPSRGLPIVFTPKRWIVAAPCRLVFENKDLVQLLWMTWEMLFRKSCLFGSIQMWIDKDVPFAEWTGSRLPQHNQEEIAMTIASDAVV